MKYIAILIGVLLLVSPCYAGREATQLPPAQTELQPQDTYSERILDSNKKLIYEIDTAGNVFSAGRITSSYLSYVTDFATAVTQWNNANSNWVLSSNLPLSGASYSVRANVIALAGASLYSTTGTIINFHGPFDAGLFAMFNNAKNTTGVTILFHSDSVKEVYPEWWNSNAVPGTTDMTDAIKSAIDSVQYITNQPVGNYYIGSSTAIVLQTTKYKMTSGVTCTNPYMTIRGDQSMLIQSGTSEHILAFDGGHHVRVKGVKFINGYDQLRFGNANLSRGTLYIDDTSFHGCSGFGIQTYVSSGATNLSTAMNLTNVDFHECKQAIYNAAGMMTHWNGGWWSFAYVDMGNRAQIENHADLHIFNVTGVPNNTQSAGGRWVDNYAWFQAKDVRFGGEGDGMPIVYQYDLAVNTGTRLSGGVVDIQSCLMAAGNYLVNQKVLHLVDGIPQKIIIKNNDTTRLQNLELITVAGTFDLAAYIAALNYQTRIFIDIGIANAANPPFMSIGLPTALLNSDQNKIILSEETRIHAYGLRRGLLHFDNTLANTVYVPEEYTKGPAFWTLTSGATISTTNPRFGKGCLSLIGNTRYVETTGVTSLGEAFTVEFWFRMDNSAANYNIFSATNAGGYGLTLYHDGGTNQLALYASSDGATFDVADGVSGFKTDFNSNVWYKTALEYTGTTYYVYVGSFESGVTGVTKDIEVGSTSHICDITIIKLGRNTAGLVGAIDEFRMLLDDYRYGSVFMPESQPFKVD